MTAFKKQFLLTLAAALVFASAAFGAEALPAGDTSLGAMHFEAPDAYSTVRRMTS